VWSFVVLFLSCVCACDLFLFDGTCVVFYFFTVRVFCLDSCPRCWAATRLGSSSCTTSPSPRSATCAQPLPTAILPLQDILLLQGFCARINPLFNTPPTCIAHTIAILLHDYCAIYDPPPSELPFVCHIPYNNGDGNIV